MRILRLILLVANLAAVLFIYWSVKGLFGYRRFGWLELGFLFVLLALPAVNFLYILVTRPTPGQK